MACVLLRLLGLAALAVTAPTILEARQTTSNSQTKIEPWDAGAVSRYPIHSSCNATQAHQIALGLNETIELAAHARNHVLRWGNSSEIYRKYFGSRPSFEVIGAYEIVINGDKAGVLFRCDNPDGNCALKGWGGHWRGSNATSETVICDLSYETRKSLSQMCALGYTVAESPSNFYWASDLLHRLYHIPAIGQGHIEHYAEDYAEAIELAAGDEDQSTHDSDTLQFFALEAYAHDIAVPGVGCPGTSANSTSGAVVSATMSTPTVTQAPSSTSELPANCHTHEGGDVHCTKR